MPALDAVCFDLDGTLCVSAHDTDRLLARAFEDAGVDPLFDVDDLWAIDTSTLPTAGTDLEFFTNLFREGAARAADDVPRDEIDRVAEAYLDHHDPTAVEPRNGALEALGAPAERTLFVGNSLGADITGAHATGMQSAWIPMDEPQPDPDPEPTYVLDSLAGLPELL